MSELKKIDENELGKVSGGLIFNASNISGSDPANPWEVIDNKTGNVIARYPTRDQAVSKAQSYGGNPYNAMEIDWNSLVSLRNNPIA